MPDNQPLLTIAIPTYNRSIFLAELLANLEPQLAVEKRVELIVSNNASTDQTAEVVASFQARGMAIRYLCNTQNVGPEQNFFSCFHAAVGEYVWIFGDDDLLTANALHQILSLLEQGEAEGGFDLCYLSSFGFTGQYHPPKETVLKDKLGRFAEVVCDGEYFLEKVNILLVTISANIVNKRRLEATKYPAVEHLEGTYVPQLAWIFPMIHERCRILYVWERFLAYRQLNSGGWNFWDVFGVTVERIAREYFVREPFLAEAFINGVSRYYMLGAVFDLRRQNSGVAVKQVVERLRPVLGNNWRFWVYVVPVALFPFWIARPLYWLLHGTNRLTRAMQTMFRHFGRAEQLLEPGMPTEVIKFEARQ